jgi:2-polyprenyl-6-methoxyphenol hydroxylase-like FAD-dependent oxidoreductase
LSTLDRRTDYSHESLNSGDVLIVGAGPTGLALAVWLARLGVGFRIIDRNAGVAPYSRALGVHARTLEFYQQLGFADQVVAAGVEVPSVNLWTRGSRVAGVTFGNIGEGMTPFPFVLDFAQDEHERMLVSRLTELGVTVERQTELVAFEEIGDAIHATLRKADGVEEQCSFAFIAGCDGAHSIVRTSIGADFAGGTYEHLFYVADVIARGAAIDNGIHIALDQSDLLAIFDMKGEGRVRLVGTIRPDAADGGTRALTFEDVARYPIEQLRITVDRVNWFSTYHVHHRVATRFRRGRAFLLGDAAHVHSPVGAQGMNTGIGDAVNLGWKIAAVIRDRANPQLLDTYETERRTFALRLVATTDRVFEIATRHGRLAAFMRTRVIPTVISNVFRLGVARRFLFRTVSQIGISYSHSPLSAGRAGAVRGGDRLPWVPPADASAAGSNYAPLASLRWQVHVYGDVPADVARTCDELGVQAHGFAWTPAMKGAGLVRNALYLVRPDGYIALADSECSAGRLRQYIRRIVAPSKPD